jgi:hypothetical protein
MRRLLAVFFSIFGFGGSAALAVGPDSEGWFTFFRQSADNRVSTILVDQDLLRWMVDSPLGFELIISVDIMDATEAGLPGKAELAFLYSVEDRLTVEMKRSAQGRLMGHTFGQGKATYHVYIDTQDDALLRRLTEVGKGLRASTSVQIAPVSASRLNQHVLNPSPAEDQVAKDTMVLRQLAEDGDIAAASREIEHWAYFPDRASADRFAAIISAEGMSVLSLDEPAEAPGKVQVYFSHVGSVLPDDISSITIHLDELATRAGGQYDGWATPVIRHN